MYGFGGGPNDWLDIVSLALVMVGSATSGLLPKPG
jgi:hypothetical protein